MNAQPPVLRLERLTRDLRFFTLEVDLTCDRWPLIVLGPSGAGKTALLRLLAGLDIPDAGRITFGDQIWCQETGAPASVPAFRRPIGYCHQDPLLFPHRSVFENVGFPLSNLRPRLSTQERQEQALEELTRWEAAHLASARPGSLSGGEQSRVALARAFVRRPELLLMDEPFAALDPPSREALLSRVVSELRVRQTPMVWVTHDRSEAVTLGGTLAVLLEGRVAQIGPAEEVFRRPATPAVAAFVGAGTVLHGFVQAREGGLMRLRCGPVLLRAAGSLPPGSPVIATIRSEEIELLLPEEAADDTAAIDLADTPPGAKRAPGSTGRSATAPNAATHRRTSARNELPAVVVSVRSLGLHCLIELDAGIPLTAAITRSACEELELAPGRPVRARIKALAVQVRTENWISG